MENSTTFNHSYNFMNAMNDCHQQWFAFACNHAASCSANLNTVILHTAFVVCIFSVVISLTFDVVNTVSLINFINVIIILAENYLLYKQRLRL